MKKRFDYMDGLKFFAALWIFAVHFISSDVPSLLGLWSGFLLRGVSGKLAVAILAVILGYLAYDKGTKSDKLGEIILKRYVQFVVMGIIINIFGAANKGYNFTQPMTYISIVATSLTLGKQLASIFWCMQAFFFASVISYIAGKYKMSEFPIILLIGTFYLTGNVWVSVCLMGNLLCRFTNFEAFPKREKILSNPLTQIILFVIAFFAIKRSESDLTYFIDGICCMLILFIFAANKTLRKIFGCKVLAYLGKQSMGIFLLHPFIYPSVSNFVYSHFPNLPVIHLFAFIASLIIVVLLSVIVVFIIGKASQLINKILLAIRDLVIKISAKIIPQN